eukprot:1143363-Pelagomonas_calceolata.AAC.2
MPLIPELHLHWLGASVVPAYGTCPRAVTAPAWSISCACAWMPYIMQGWIQHCHQVQAASPAPGAVGL